MEQPRRLTRDDVILLTLGVWALRSSCKTGNSAILERNGRILAIGYNGAPAGEPHCRDAGCILDDHGHCKRTIHAELNVIRTCAKYGISTIGANLWCSTAPCPTCAGLVCDMGIADVFYCKEYTDMTGVHLLRSRGIPVKQRSVCLPDEPQEAGYLP